MNWVGGLFVCAWHRIYDNSWRASSVSFPFGACWHHQLAFDQQYVTACQSAFCNAYERAILFQGGGAMNVYRMPDRWSCMWLQHTARAQITSLDSQHPYHIISFS